MRKLGIGLISAAVCFTALAVPTASMAGDLYGAIAYSQETRNYAWSTDFASQSEAENAAMDECYNKASDCKVATWFRNACGSLAVGEDGGWGANWGKNFRQAQNKAVNQCNGASYNCSVVVTKCVAGY